MNKPADIKIPGGRQYIFLLLFSCCFFWCNTAEAQEEEMTDTAVSIETAPDEASPRPEYFLPIEATADSERLELRRLPEAELRKYKADESFWYANYDFNEKKKQAGSFFSTRSFRNVLWIIIVACFVAVIIWYLVYSKVGLFSRSDKEILTADGPDEETDDIFSINYGQQIEKAAAAGNFRLAIRFMFLRLLRDLSQKNIIQYRQGRTNFEYLVQLHPTVYYKEFFSLVRSYEYAWYGKVDINPETYSRVKKDFEGFRINYIIR